MKQDKAESPPWEKRTNTDAREFTRTADWTGKAALRLIIKEAQVLQCLHQDGYHLL